MAQTSWRGTVNNDWSNPGNWTAGVPTAAVDAIIGDGSFTGANQPNLSVKSACKSLTIGTGIRVCTLRVDKNFTVNGNLTIGPRGTITHTGRPFSLVGNWENSGVYNASGGGSTGVAFVGAAQSLRGNTTFRKLTINAGSSTVLDADITIATQLTVSGTLDPNEGPTHIVSGGGKLAVTSGGKLLVKAATFGGNYTLNGGTTLNAASTVDYAASTLNQTINNSLVYGTLRTSGGLTKTLAGNLPALNSSGATAGNLIVAAGTLDLGSFLANRGTSSAGGTLSVANGATLRIGGTRSFPVNYATRSLGVSSTVEYSGGNQSVSAEAYGNLVLSVSSGAAIKTLPSAPMTIAGNLTSTAAAGSSLSFSAGGPLTVNGSVSVGGQTTFNGSSFAHAISGNWTNHGTFNGNTSTLTLRGNGAALVGTGTNRFNNLTLAGPGITAAPNTALGVDGNLSTTGAGTFTHLPGGTGAVSLSGSGKSISGSGIIFNNLTVSGSIGTSSSFEIAGDLQVSGSFSATAGSITLSGAANTISGSGTIQFYALTVTGSISTASSFRLQSDLSVVGTFTASAGTATFGGVSSLSGTANLFNVTLNGVKLQLGTGAVLGVAGTFALTGGVWDVTSTVPNTVNYNGAAAQALVSLTYDNLVLSGGGPKAVIGPLTVNNDLTIVAGTVFNAGSFTHLLYRDWNNNGAFSAGTGTIQLIGNQDSFITGQSAFNTLTLNKTSAASVVALKGDTTVNNLNMTQGNIRTGTNSITITSDRTGSGIILGTITRTHVFLPGLRYAFEGPNNTLNFSAATGVSSVTMTVGVGPVTDFPFGNSLNRQYAISVSAAGPYQAALRLHYLDPELNGNNESTMALWKNEGAWTPSGKSANDATDNWVELDGLTNLAGRWTMADSLVNVARWTGALSTAWETAGNWVATQGGPALPPSSNDVVELGFSPFVRPPTINSIVAVKSLAFGSAQATSLTLGTGGSLRSLGNISGVWTNDATHQIIVGAQVLDVRGDLVLSDGTNGRAIHLDIGSGTVTVAGPLTQSGGANLAFSGPGTLNLQDDFHYVSGTFTSGGGSVIYHGAKAQQVAGGISYHHLEMRKSAGIATLSNPATVAGNLTLSSNSVVVVQAGMAVAGNVVIGGGTSLQSGAATITVGGDWIRGGTFVPGLGTVTFNGGALQSIGASSFNNLTVNSPNGVAVPTGNLSVNGDLSILAGTLDLGSFTANRSVSGGALALGSGATLRIGTSFPSNFGSRTLNSSSVVEYRGTGPQTVSAETYGHLYLSNGGGNAKSLSGPTPIAGDLLINTNAALDAGIFTLQLMGHWTNSGAFAAGSSSVRLGGVSKILSGSTTFDDLSVSGGYTLLSGMTVNGTMDLSGTLACGNTTNVFAGDFFDNGTLTSGGMITFPGARPQAIILNGGFVSTGTVNFNGTIASAVGGDTGPVLQDVNINNTGGIAPGNNWTVNGAFAVGGGGIFTAGSATHLFNGSFNNQGTVTSSGTLIFSPSNPVTLTLRAAGLFSSAGTVRFGGSGLITLAGGSPSFNSVSIANLHPAGLTPASNWILVGDLLIDSGALLNGGAGLTHTIFGTWTDNGTFNGAGCTISMNGETEIAGIGSTTFNHLLIVGTVTAVTDFDVAGNFTNNGLFDGTGATVRFVGGAPSSLGGTSSPTPFDSLHVAKAAASVNLGVALSGLTDLFISDGTLDLSNFTITQDSVLGGALTLGPSAVLRIGGANALPTFNVITLDPASTVEFYGTGSQPIAAVNYGNLLSTSTGNRVLPNSGRVGIAGTFTPGANSYTITGSTFDFNGAGAQTIPAFNYNHLTSSSSGHRVLALSGIIGVAGLFTPGANAYTVTNSTINFNGGSQTIPAFTYHNLRTSGSGTKTLSGDISINGALSLAGGTLADGGFTAAVNGDASNGASHAGTGKILLTGGSAPHVLSGGGSYGNLELNDTNGALLNLTNLTVNGILTLADGLISTSTNRVILTGAGSVRRTAGHVVGNLQKSFATGAVRSNLFEIGDAGNYTPVSLIFSNVTSAGNVTARSTPLEHPDILSSGVSKTRGVNRYWTLTRTSLAFANYSALFNFVSGDLDAFADPTNFKIAQNTGGTWSLRNPSLVTATNIQAVGFTTMSDFAIGEAPPPPPAIAAQPQSQRVNIGSNATFSVTATGAGTLSYQWRFNGTDLPGANLPTLTLTGVQDSDAGNYSVAIDNGAITVSSEALLAINHAPTFSSIAQQTVDEGALLTVSIPASDPDGGPLAYTLTESPPGASIDPNTGLVSWTATEAQGPGTYPFTRTVADDGAPPLRATNSFTVLVNEINSAPVLTVPPDQTIDELATFTASAGATDPDLPANQLSFGLLSPPADLSIDSASGRITWAPTEEQGPGSYGITVLVIDNNPDAINAKQLVDTKTFTLTVNEVNSAPVLTVVPPQSIRLGETLTVTNVAVDSDVPANVLTFDLLSAPAEMVVDPQTGVITWSPQDPQQSTSNLVTVRVRDNGQPPLSGTNNFMVTVIGLSPRITSIQHSNGVIVLALEGVPGQTHLIQATPSLRPIGWVVIGTNTTGINGLSQFIDADIARFPMRFYRSIKP